MMCKAVCVHSPGGCCRCLTSADCCPLHQPSGVRGDCSFLQSIWASSQEMRKGKRGPAARAEAAGLLRLGSEQGMPRASRGAQGLCTACQRLESHWAADPRASLRERTHLVRTQENFVQFFTLFSVFFNFFWVCWSLVSCPVYTNLSLAFKKIALGSWVFRRKKMQQSYLKALFTQHHKD